MGGRSGVQVAVATVVVVVGAYNLVLLGPATSWLEANAFVDFGSALPAPTQFLVDAHWVLFAGVVLTHVFAVWASKLRGGVALCIAALLTSVLLTLCWVFAMHLPFFSIAGAIQ
jgi:hypothetical protein